MIKCSVKGCDRIARRKSSGSMCEAHYQRKRAGRDLHAPFLAKPGTGMKLVEAALLHTGSDCLIWPLGKTKSGRAAFLVAGKMHYVSRYVCERKHGPAPSPRHEAAHKCGKGDKGCYSPNCVYWATPSENIADKVRHGTDFRGERSPNAILTDAEARQIYKAKGAREDLAKKFGISPTTVSRIKLGQRYAHATGLLS